jgi:RNase P/RNase MRP subunit POP5
LLKRVKRRYLALAIESSEIIRADEFVDAVWRAVSKMFGECGASQTSLSLISFDEQKRFAVMRTAHTAIEMVRAALATMTKIGNKPAAVHVLRVSGTIKALYRKTKP